MNPMDARDSLLPCDSPSLGEASDGGMPGVPQDTQTTLAFANGASPGDVDEDCLELLRSIAELRAAHALPRVVSSSPLGRSSEAESPHQ